MSQNSRNTRIRWFRGLATLKDILSCGHRGTPKSCGKHKQSYQNEVSISFGIRYSACNTVHYQTHKYKGLVGNQAPDNKDATQKLPEACKEVF